MTVTTLDPTRRRSARRPARPPTPDGVRVSFDVVLGGATAYADAVELIEALRRLTAPWESASLEVVTAPVDEPAAEPSDRRIVVRPATRDVLVDGEPVALTRLEFDLLHFLGSNPRRVFSRPQLLQSVWGYSHAGLRTVDVHMRRIRAKLGDVPLVTTVRGVGYRLADEADLGIAS